MILSRMRRWGDLFEKEVLTAPKPVAPPAAPTETVAPATDTDLAPTETTKTTATTETAPTETTETTPSPPTTTT
jgi:hypothetical protein